MRAWQLFKHNVFDVLILLAAAGGLAEVTADRGDPGSVAGSFWILIPMVLLLTLPLLLRRRWPFGVPAAVVVAAGVISFLEGRAVPYSFATFLAVLASSFLFGMLRDQTQAIAGLAMLLLADAVVVYNDPDGAPGEFFFIALLFTAAWIGGFVLDRRLSAASEAEERARRLEEDARRAVDVERQRIARELHDVIAHSVSVMTVQAGAVRRLLLPEQQKERAALETVEATGREALTEMRRLVGLLREQGAMPEFSPQPSMKTLDVLIGNVREAGLPVELSVEGEPRALAPGVDLSAYRVVQEALTNALKYAGPARAWVNIRWHERELELEIANDGQGTGQGNGSGHGLVGMQERVSLVGGTIESGRHPVSGFVVKVRLPLEESA